MDTLNDPFDNEEYEDWGENDDPENPEPPPRWPSDVALGWYDPLTELAEFMLHRAELCGADALAGVLKAEVLPLCGWHAAKLHRRDVAKRKGEIEAEERQAIETEEQWRRAANGGF